jgi:hypothetical protein
VPIFPAFQAIFGYHVLHRFDSQVNNPIIFPFANSTSILEVVEETRLLAYHQFRNRQSQVFLQPFGHQPAVAELAGSFPAQKNGVLPQIIEDLLGVQVVQNLLIFDPVGRLSHLQHLWPGRQGRIAPPLVPLGIPQGNGDAVLQVLRLPAYPGKIAGLHVTSFQEVRIRFLH